MAYMSQENKKKIAAELKKIIPSTWKWSLRVRHHSTLSLTITRADIDLYTLHSAAPENKGSYIQVNEYYLADQFKGEALTIMQDISNAMNAGNHDNSDSMTDYFDVGWYTDINIGGFERPFTFVPSNRKPYVFTAATEAPKTDRRDMTRFTPLFTAQQAMERVMTLRTQAAQA